MNNYDEFMKFARENENPGLEETFRQIAEELNAAERKKVPKLGKYGEIDLLTKENKRLYDELQEANQKLTHREMAARVNIMIQQKQIARLTDENLEMKEACQELSHALLESAVAMFGLEKENEELKRRLNNDNL